MKPQLDRRELFSHFGESLELVKVNMYSAKNNSFIGAYLMGNLQVLSKYFMATTLL